MAEQQFDVAVIGLGALGAATLWRLAEQGVKAIGIDQFTPPHDLGATHGKTRLFRTFCLEHPVLGDYARLSRRLFQSLEQSSGGSLLSITGGTIIGRPDSQAVSGTLQAAQRLGVQLPVWSSTELAARQPQHIGLRSDEVAVVDSEAGVANPECFIRAALQRAQQLSAQVLTPVRVDAVQDHGAAVRIVTSAGEIRASQVVIAGGAWLTRFAPDLPLDPVRTIMTWFDPVAGYSLDAFPVFVREISPQLTLWGHGAQAGGLVKLGLGDVGVPRTALNLENPDRHIAREDTAELRAAVRQWLEDISPEPASAHPCMITRTPDAQFIVGRYRGNILVAGGDNGHAFKHAPAIGEVLARQAQGSTVELETAFIDPQRFAH
ncbi:N-methyl-L-tryptophan oxidase [Klebsiella michiganensis]|uniref:N-methyl-L-tryptophan oxidase n=1 Tax=Klebsiella michiganensis TaxID=1134687 RepID=UPI0018C6F031|nr:N-methyl-L-tryptophan oxidase [Klebsiella michiganensis]MBG2621095.1 N-methyl-L-tryptophan oxidase [Klebsiella michiganensis]